MRSQRMRSPVWLLAVLVAVPLGIFGLVGAPSASADPPSPIKHVVVLYLENHSFDSILGFWCDEHPGRCPQGGMPSSVTLADGTTVEPKVEPDIVPKMPHGVTAQEKVLRNEWDALNGCKAAKAYACIGGYTAAQQPNTTTLADKFAINDDTFSMADSPSWGGHLYAVMGQLDGFIGENAKGAGETGEVETEGAEGGPGWGCDSDKLSAWAPSVGAPTEEIPSCIPDFNLNPLEYPFGGAFEATPAQNAETIMDNLEAGHLSWKIFGDPNPLTNGKTTPGYIWDTCPSIAECLYTNQKNNNVQSSSFPAEAEAGNLPNFSLVVPAGATAPYSEHNQTSMTAGDDWIGEIANAVMSGPEWNSTALFITWDDCGCFYDQVKPGVNPDGTPQGPRSPLIVVSPYAKPEFTDHKQATFVSILSYVEHNFGLPPMGVNEEGAYDLRDAFDYDQKPLSAIPMVHRALPSDALDVPVGALNEDT